MLGHRSVRHDTETRPRLQRKRWKENRRKTVFSLRRLVCVALHRRHTTLTCAQVRTHAQVARSRQHQRVPRGPGLSESKDRGEGEGQTSLLVRA